MSPSPLQLLIVALVIFLLFGAGRLSDLGKGLGEGIKNFKKGIADDDDSDEPPKQIPPSETTEAKSEKQEEAKS